MEREELKSNIAATFPSANMEEANEWLSVLIPASDWLTFAGYLRNEPAYYFDYLFCVTCIDWKTHLSMVYHLSSTVYRHNIVVKVNLDKTHPEIDSVCPFWKTAEFNEREAYEMFGVNFKNHPDLRLLILPDGWEGRNPMRKDFEDPVNLIRL